MGFVLGEAKGRDYSTLAPLVLVGASEDNSGAGNDGVCYWTDIRFEDREAYANDRRTGTPSGKAVFQPHLAQDPQDPCAMVFYLGLVIDYSSEEKSNYESGISTNVVVMKSADGNWYLGHQLYMPGNNVDCPAGESFSVLFTGTIEDILRSPLAACGEIRKGQSASLSLTSEPKELAERISPPGMASYTFRATNGLFTFSYLPLSERESGKPLAEIANLTFLVGYSGK